MTDQEPVRTRRTMACFWWQHERDAQLHNDVLAVRRTENAENAGRDDQAARHLPAAG